IAEVEVSAVVRAVIGVEPQQQRSLHVRENHQAYRYRSRSIQRREPRAVAVRCHFPTPRASLARLLLTSTAAPSIGRRVRDLPPYALAWPAWAWPARASLILCARIAASRCMPTAEVVFPAAARSGARSANRHQRGAGPILWWAEWLRRRVGSDRGRCARARRASAPRVAGGVSPHRRAARAGVDVRKAGLAYSSDPRLPPVAAWSGGAEDHTTYGFASRGVLLSVGGEGSKCAAGAVGSS